MVNDHASSSKRIPFRNLTNFSLIPPTTDLVARCLKTYSVNNSISLSWQSCKQGYYRSRVGACIKCECHGHSDFGCDPKTGGCKVSGYAHYNIFFLVLQKLGLVNRLISFFFSVCFIRIVNTILKVYDARSV